MAWAERLPSGRYRGVYRDGTGKRRSAGTFAHKYRAERAAATAEGKARRSSWADPEAGKRPWGEWVEEWWPTRGVEPGTLRRDVSRRRVHLDPRWAEIPVASIRRHDVKAWAASMRRRGVGASTVQRAVHLLSASLAAAVDAEVIEVNPAARMKLPKGQQASERFLTREEYDAVQAQMPTTDDQLVMHVLTFTGLRWGEMAGLHWNRLDLDRGVLRVAEVFDEVTSTIKPYPKGRKVREVPVPGWLVELLAQRPRTHGCGVAHVSGKCRSGLVLSTETGHVLRNSNWSDVWRRAVDLAEIGDVRIHDCRHTYISWLVQDGVPLEEAGRLAGHVSTATTAKYRHLTDIPTDAVMAALRAPGLVAPQNGAPFLPHDAGDADATHGL